MQDYTASMYLRQFWHDPRLAFEHKVSDQSRLSDILLPDGSWNQIWIPDTFFQNEKGASFHDVTVSNRFIRVSASGSVSYSTRLFVT